MCTASILILAGISIVLIQTTVVAGTCPTDIAVSDCTQFRLITETRDKAFRKAMHPLTGTPVSPQESCRYAREEYECQEEFLTRCPAEAQHFADGITARQEQHAGKTVAEILAVVHTDMAAMQAYCQDYL